MKTAIRLPGGDLEYAVLGALWEIGEASAREVHDRIGAPAGLVYTTTAKVLDRLRAKKLVSRRKRGKRLVFDARIPRARVEEARAQDILGRLLGSTPQRAIAALVGAVEAIDPQLLEELAHEIEVRRRSSRGS